MCVCVCVYIYVYSCSSACRINQKMEITRFYNQKTKRSYLLHELVLWDSKVNRFTQ